MLRHIYIEIPITWSNSWFGAVGADGDAKSLSVPITWSNSWFGAVGADGDAKSLSVPGCV